MPVSIHILIQRRRDKRPSIEGPAAIAGMAQMALWTNPRLGALTEHMNAPPDVTPEARSCGATQQPAVAGRPLRALRVMTFATFTKAKRRLDARKQNLADLMAYRRAGVGVYDCITPLSEYTGQRWIDCVHLVMFLRRKVTERPTTLGTFKLSNCMVVTDSMFAVARREESQLRMAAAASMPALGN